MPHRHHGFARCERLRCRRDFLRIGSIGKKAYSTNFIVVMAVSDQACTRFGVTVSRKVGTAVVRNRIKRKLREFFRLHKELFLQGDYNVIARQGARTLDQSSLGRELQSSLRRLATPPCS